MAECEFCYCEIEKGSDHAHSCPYFGHEPSPASQAGSNLADFEYTDNPVCPYCGHVERDAWEIDFGPGLDGDAETFCGMCGKDYFVSRNTFVSYSTKKI